MEKLSAEERLVLSRVPGTIRDLVQVIRDRDEKIASYERDKRIAKIAQTLEQKGISDGKSREDIIKDLSSAGEDLDVIEKAADLGVPNISLGSLGTNPDGGDNKWNELNRVLFKQ